VRYTLTIILTIGLCFLAQSIALNASGGRTLKSESNFFSSLGRIQAGAYANQKIIVLGSSITGRLPDSAQGFDQLSNMGCDGGNAIDALRAVDRGILPSAPWIFVEANTLFLSLANHPTEISNSFETAWFQVGMKYPLLSAYARPSAFLYSKLLAKKTGSFDLEDSKQGFGFEIFPNPVDSNEVYEVTKKEAELVSETAAIIQRLQDHGSKVVIVWLPPARSTPNPPEWILSLARSSGAYWWDLAQNIPQKKVRLTDKIHMDATSAARTTSELLHAIQFLESVE
jgi:hypothetical protein